MRLSSIIVGHGGKRVSSASFNFASIRGIAARNHKTTTHHSQLLHLNIIANAVFIALPPDHHIICKFAGSGSRAASSGYNPGSNNMNASFSVLGDITGRIRPAIELLSFQSLRVLTGGFASAVGGCSSRPAPRTAYSYRLRELEGRDCTKIHFRIRML